MWVDARMRLSRHSVLAGSFHQGNWGVALICLSYLLLIFSSPMPASISWVEMLMGVVLILGGLISITPLRSFLEENIKVIFLFIFLIIFPLVVGIRVGSTPLNMVRDIAPLLYQLGIPIMLLSQAKRAEHFPVELLIASLLIVGGISSIQFLIGIDNLYGSINSFMNIMSQSLAGLTPPEAGVLVLHSTQLSPEEFSEAQKNYFLKVYEPGVIFSAIYLTCTAMKSLMSSERKYMRALLIMILAMVCIVPMAILALRAYILVFILACVAYFISLLQRQHRVLKWPYYLGGMIVIISLAMSMYFSGVLQQLIRKQALVGDNGKLTEWRAVIGMISSDPTFLFHGIGWGGILNNPAYPAHVSRFTHSILSFYLLKSGLFGLLLFLAVVRQLIGQAKIALSFILSRDAITPVSVSCLAALLMGVLFQPTYKMLGFGIVLALMMLDWRYDGKPT